jgi:uncharacterized protein
MGGVEQGEIAARANIRALGSVLVAYSGGVDSTVVLKLALDELGSDHVLAVTAHGDVHTSEELEAAREVAARLGAPHVIIRTHELGVPGFAANPPDRCYMCRSSMYQRLLELAREEGLAAVVDGANLDDQGDYRPGIRAGVELGVLSPLADAGMGKQAVRELALDLGLPNWSRPASPCLSSRFPYGEEITLARLAMVAEAERRIRELGFRVCRVRHHGNLARVEVPMGDLRDALDPSVRDVIVDSLRELGYAYVTLDLQGFRSGSLNEVLETAADTDRDERAATEESRGLGRFQSGA